MKQQPLKLKPILELRFDAASFAISPSDHIPNCSDRPRSRVYIDLGFLATPENTRQVGRNACEKPDS